LPKKAPPAADLRGSAGPPRVTHSLTGRKIKLRRLLVERERDYDSTCYSCSGCLHTSTIIYCIYEKEKITYPD
jgi:hypothetical protein